MDYMLNPMICVIWISNRPTCSCPTFLLDLGDPGDAHVHRPERSRHPRLGRINTGLAVGMGVVIVIFFAAAARFIFHGPHAGLAFWTLPFYNPATFNVETVLGGTSIAVLTYIGFDGISTLSEEVENPRRNILLATVLTCVAIGFLSASKCTPRSS